MEKIKISKEEILAYRKTPNGRRKRIWMYVGAFIDILATLGIGILFINSYRLSSEAYFYGGLFVLQVIVVLGGELIGVYFGALEQYFYDQYQKKEIDIDE